MGRRYVTVAPSTDVARSWWAAPWLEVDLSYGPPQVVGYYIAGDHTDEEACRMIFMRARLDASSLRDHHADE